MIWLAFAVVVLTLLFLAYAFALEHKARMAVYDAMEMRGGDLNDKRR